MLPQLLEEKTPNRRFHYPQTHHRYQSKGDVEVMSGHSGRKDIINTNEGKKDSLHFFFVEKLAMLPVHKSSFKRFSNKYIQNN